LNTGSTKLSPQELRQALMPGPYSDYVDDRASASQPLQSLLGLSEPDYRMRDVELLARHIAFTFFMPDYPGRMKEFLDYACSTLNEKWDSMRDPVEQAVLNFEAAIKSMVLVFGGEGNVARKPGSRIINRTIFDTLALYFSREEVREYAESNIEAVNLEYERLFLDRAFVSSVDRDTASPLNITYRIKVMGQILDPSLPVVES
jgi:hypothetical protein